MAQLRQDYTKIVASETELLVLGPDDLEAFQDHWEKNDLPFVGLPDPELRVLNLYRQQAKLLKMGRMPAILVIDKAGRIRYRHYGDSMADIPSNEEILEVLNLINQENR